MPQDGELLFLAGQRPVLARKLRYYADREFTGLFDLPDVSVPTSDFAPHRAVAR